MPISVLKFGGTSLASHEDFHRIAAGLADREEDIVIVVSAQAGTTDQLLLKMRDLTEQPPVHAVDALLTTGEQQSAALMAAALTVAGRRAEVVPPWDIFETNGDFGDADIDEYGGHPAGRSSRCCEITWSQVDYGKFPVRLTSTDSHSTRRLSC